MKKEDEGLNTLSFDVKREEKTKQRQISWAKMTTIVAGLITAIAVFFAYDISADAKGIVYTGSTEYNATSGQDFNVGVYLGGDNGEKTGDYEAVISYDENYLTYIGGANEGGNGKVSVSGTSADGGRVKVMITFHAVIGGETSVKVENATLTDNNGATLAIEEFPEVPVHIAAPAADAPEFIMFNGEMLPAYSADVKEYSLDTEYTENFEFSVPEGFKIVSDTEGLEAGVNEITLLVTQDNRTPLEYKITVNMEAPEAEEPEVQENTAEVTENTEEVSEETATEPAEETATEENVLTENNAETVPGNVNTENVNVAAKKPWQNENTKSFIILGLFAAAILVILLLKVTWDRLGMAGRGIQRGFRIIQKKVTKNTYQPMQTTDDGFNLSRLEETEVSDEEITLDTPENNEAANNEPVESISHTRSDIDLHMNYREKFAYSDEDIEMVDLSKENEEMN
ncbi:MAG: hypothetical protein J5521_10755 [Lachnospiraceae bacterium]|nr:hypothetical protein [Lachnospiraceae bacterium]